MIFQVFRQQTTNDLDDSSRLPFGSLWVSLSEEKKIKFYLGQNHLELSARPVTLQFKLCPCLINSVERCRREKGGNPEEVAYSSPPPTCFAFPQQNYAAPDNLNSDLFWI